MDLPGFLAARLDEDEAAALESKNAPAGAMRFTDVDHWSYALLDVAGEERVLREVAAKRAILELHVLDAESYLDGDGIERPGHHCWECDQREWPCPTLYRIAAVYSDHPDYDDAWKP